MDFELEPAAATATARAAMGRLATARDAVNAAYNAMSSAPDPELARGYVQEAHDAVHAAAGAPAQHVASAAARAVLPRLEHALQLLTGLGVASDPARVEQLLDELGCAMDHVEQALVAVGWE